MNCYKAGCKATAEFEKLELGNGRWTYRLGAWSEPADHHHAVAQEGTNGATFRKPATRRNRKPRSAV